MLLGVPTLDDQPMASVDGSTGTELGVEERDDVLVRPVHTLADVGKVGKDRLLVAVPEHLRGSDRVSTSVAGQFRVLRAQDSEGAREKLRERGCNDRSQCAGR